MSNPQHEPTMEEILASIRKIISEDASEPAPADAPVAAPHAAPEYQPEPVPAPRMEAPAPVPHYQEPEEDVLELTDEVVEQPAMPAAAMAPAPAAYHEPVPQDDIEFQHLDDTSVVIAPEPAHEPVMAAAEGRDHGIFSDRSRKAMDDIFASITPEDEEEEEEMYHAPAPASFAHTTSADSVEAVFERAVRGGFDPVLKAWLATNREDLIEHMKPVIRDWLDEHFPPMLEEAVRNEVARVAKARTPRR